jgi:hypothetical protein
MEKPSNKDLQNFAAGALALMGLSAIIRLPHELLSGTEKGVALASGIAALTLPLAIGILGRSRIALHVTKVYLWTAVIGGWTLVIILLRTLSWQSLFGPWARFIGSVVVATVLLVLFCRARSSEP